MSKRNNQKQWNYTLPILQVASSHRGAEQIDFDKFYLDSIISNSVSLVDDDYGTVIDQSEVGKWSIKPSLAEKMVDILEYVVDKDEFTTEQIVSHFGFNATTTKRYLRQLTEFGYLEPHGGNKNRTYSKKEQ